MYFWGMKRARRDFAPGVRTGRSQRQARQIRLAMVLVLAATIIPIAAPVGRALAASSFSDGFESGTLAAWQVRTTVGGQAIVDGSVVAGGTSAARLSAQGTGSSAYIRRALTTPEPVVTVVADVQVVAEGANGSNVPLLRLFSPTGTRLLSLYRQNGNTNKVYVQHSGTTATTSARLTLGVWAHVEVRTTVATGGSTIEVLINGIRAYLTTTATLDPSIGTVQFGNDTTSQAFNLAVDNVSVETSAAPAPSGTPSPAPSVAPSEAPSAAPSATPSAAPSAQPSDPASPAPSDPASPTPPASTAPTPDPAAGTASLFSDGFESGTVNGWDLRRVGTGGSAAAQTAIVRTGTYAARLSAAGTGSYAYLRETLAVPQTSLKISLNVRVEAEGASGGNVPLLRLFDSAGTRVVSVYRQNLSSDKVYVQQSGQFLWTAGLLPLGTWKQLELSITPNGSASTLEIRLNGVVVFSTTASTVPPIASLQVGNDSSSQTFDLVVDDVDVQATGGDTTAPDTTITAGPSGTVASSGATFQFSSSEAGSTFSCSLDGAPYTTCTSPQDYSALGDGSHTFAVRATDPAGLTDPSPASRTWTVSLGTSCDPAAAAPTNSDPGAVVIAENYETGLSKWTKITQQGDALVSTTSAAAKTGRCSGMLHVTTAVWDSRANMMKSLPAGTNEIYARGWFRVAAEGVNSTWNTPTFRFLSNGKRVLDVSRQNVTGNFFVRFPDKAGGWTIPSTGKSMQVGRWYDVRVHAIANGLLSTVEVWLDGTRVYATTTATLGVDRFDVAMVGAEHQNQEGDVQADDVVVKAIAADPSAPLFADGFEQDLLGWDSVVVGADGTATAQTSIVKTGAKSALLTGTTTSGSFAYLRKNLRQAETDLTATTDFRVVSEGPSTGYIPVMTLNDVSNAPLVTLWRRNVSGSLTVQYGGVSYVVNGTLPLGQWSRIAIHVICRAGATGTVIVTIDGVQAYRSDTASIGTTGIRSVQLGNNGGAKPFSFAYDGVDISRGTQGIVDDSGTKLLIADHLNKRLLITDFSGRVVWKWDNPTGRPLTEDATGPLGVRWMPNNQILATFGTGEVGLIDVATKKFVWKTSGYNGDWFQSPYDAELLPDGNLAVALRFNNGGRISVYDRTTGTEVWRHLLSNAHAVHFRTAAESYNSDDPTLLVGGWGNIREVAYRLNGGQNVTWQVKTEYTHDAIVVENDRILTTEGYYIQKIDRIGTQLWKRSTPDENRRIAVNPNVGGGYVYTVGESDRVEIRDINGYLIRDWSMLSDGTGLDYPYGIQVIQYPG
jgi:hypothetical protein